MVKDTQTGREILPPGHTLVRVRSHRATDKLKRLLGVQLKWFWTWDCNSYVAVPDDRLAEVRAIAGITLARPKGDIRPCWEF